MQAILTTADAAKRLGVTPSAISRLVAAGTLKPAKKLPGVRGAFLFTVDELDRVLEERSS